MTGALLDWSFACLTAQDVTTISIRLSQTASRMHWTHSDTGFPWLTWKITVKQVSLSSSSSHGIRIVTEKLHHSKHNWNQHYDSTTQPPCQPLPFGPNISHHVSSVHIYIPKFGASHFLTSVFLRFYCRKTIIHTYRTYHTTTASLHYGWDRGY